MCKAHDHIDLKYKQWIYKRYNSTMVCDHIDFKTGYT